MALSDIVPINRREEFLQAIADKSGAPSPVTRIEEFLKRISESSGGSSLPEYTAADKGKTLTLGDGSGSETVTIVPEQTVTLAESTPSPGVTVWGGLFSGSFDEEFFENASIGDTATFVIDSGEAVESTAVSAYGMVLFPVGDYYIGDGGEIFGGVGIATFIEPASLSVTVSGTRSVPSVEPKWEAAALSFFPVTATATTHTAGITAGKMQELLISGKIPIGIASYNGEPVNTYMIAGVFTGKAGYNVNVIGAYDSITVNDLTDYPVLWSL